MHGCLIFLIINTGFLLAERIFGLHMFLFELTNESAHKQSSSPIQLTVLQKKVLNS